MKGFFLFKSKWLALPAAVLLILIILPLSTGAQPEDEEPYGESSQVAVEDIELPQTFTIEDRINDMGGTIALKWPATPSDLITTEFIPEPVDDVLPETGLVTKYQYYILHSLDPNAPMSEWEIVNPEGLSADSYFTYEEPGYFGFFLGEPDEYLEKEHYFFYNHMIPNFKHNKAIYRVKISQPLADVQPQGVEESVVEPEYKLNEFIIDAWLYYDNLDTPEFPWQENNAGDFTLTTDLAPLTREENSEMVLSFVEFDDEGLGMHFRGEKAFAKEPERGKGLIRFKATGPNNTRFSGKLKFKKAVGIPVDTVNEEESLPDNRYMHYFKLGVDYRDRQGVPRWIVEPEQRTGIVAHANFADLTKWNSFLYLTLLSISILYFIFRAKKGKDLFIRRIAGLDHVEEAIGRATEMGKPILFVPGIGYMSDIGTIAAINILGQVTKKAAEYDSQVVVPCIDPIVMSVCQEVAQEAYIDAGHPDAFNKDNIFFLTDDQFSYVATVDGIMVRDKPGAIFLMGLFYAESLILAETGAGTGAIQIAGTDAITQLPFFITTCDYTLIGEELYAASAYLSKEPLLLGSIKGQDMAKLTFIILTFLGTVVSILGVNFLTKLFSSPL